MRPTTLLGAAAIMLIPAVAACARLPEPQQAAIAEPAPPAGLTPAEIVQARQSAYHLSGAVMGNMKSVIDSKGDVKTQVFAARGLARWARVLPTMFPEATAGVTPSRAKAEIWQNKADFDAKAAAYAAAATRLAELAQAGDGAGFAAQWAAVRETCSACHNVYQAPARQ